MFWTKSHVARLRTSGRILFVTVNLRRSVAALDSAEDSTIIQNRFVRHAKEDQDRLVYMHLNPVRRGLVATPEEWRWSSYNNFALDPAKVASCRIRIDYVLLPEGCRMIQTEAHGQKGTDRD